MGSMISVMQAYNNEKERQKNKIKNNINGNSIIKNKRTSAFKKNEKKSKREYRKKYRRTIP